MGLNVNVEAIIAAIPAMLEAAREIKKIYGLIHKRATAEINGKKGFLIWDFIIYNEITFQDEDEKIISFFSSMSDEDTETVWNELVKKYGV